MPARSGRSGAEMTGTKTNERPGTRAVLRHSRVSAYKAREVLDLIRGVDYGRASEILEYTDRDVAEVVRKLLHSAASNARHNDGLDPEELFVSSCFADEGSTLKRWRPRARGRATRIRKRSCHITVILSRMPDEELRRRRAKVAAEAADRRARRVAGARRQSRASRVAASTGASEPETSTEDRELLDLVATGDDIEGPELEAAVDEAIAEAETPGEIADTGDDAAEPGDDATEPGDDVTEPGNEVAETGNEPASAGSEEESHEDHGGDEVGAPDEETSS